MVVGAFVGFVVNFWHGVTVGVISGSLFTVIWLPVLYWARRRDVNRHYEKELLELKRGRKRDVVEIGG